jgi:diguanylate cyclase (GGDEF)-like protein
MEHASAATRVVRPIDPGLLAAAAERAAREVAAHDEPAKAIEGAIEAFYEAVAGAMPSVFVLEHGRLWLVAQRGYAVVPDGITIESGITGRAVRLARAQFATDVHADPDYVPALPGVVSELAIPLRAGRVVIGILNIESERVLPEDAAEVLQPLARALAPSADALRANRTLDLSGLARLFVHLGSLRAPADIAALAAASLPRVLPVEGAQILIWNEGQAPSELGSWTSEDATRGLLSGDEIDAACTQTDPSVVCQVLELERGADGTTSRSAVWLPLRANAGELGALVGVSGQTSRVDPTHLDTAAVLAAHVATSLDAAFALRRERQSAVTDPLTGIFNRRGLEERLDGEIAVAQERRLPLSLLVIDCDDFKEINDRAGHQFGDSLLREVADVLSGSLPDGAEVARLGGDEFVVMVPGAGSDSAEALGTRIRTLLAEGLTEAGFPLRVSAGISTYPFDGATPSALLRAADQALYAAKAAGKDRVASFRALTGAAPAVAVAEPGGALGGSRRGRSDASGAVLTDAMAAAKAIEAEETVHAICTRLCKTLVFVVGATGCSASRVVDDYIVDATDHALREVSLGDEASYRISDFPVTAEVLRSGEPRAVSFADGDVDPSEAFILRDLGMSALLMLPVHVSGKTWGLIELYEMRHRRFGDEDIAVAQFLVAQAERRLEAVDDSDERLRRPAVYELPDGEPSRPRTPRVR